MNTYGYVGGNPMIYSDPKGLVYGLGSSPYSNYYTNKKAAENSLAPDTPFYGAEAHYILGLGAVSLTCTDECGVEKEFKFMKVCIGGAIGASFGGGAVFGLDGKNCKQSNYEGWFFEGGAALGPVSAGLDVGFNQNQSSKLPYGTSGVNEAHLGGGLGANLKATWCYYIPLQ